MLDIGCDDGEMTMLCANKIGANQIYGVDVVDERLVMAAKKGVNVALMDVSEGLSYDEGFFDVVHANQVIEHVPSVDIMISEIYRVLRPGGYAVISTENAASWCNVFSLLWGWQMFSLTNVSARCSGIGNPFAVHRGKTDVLSSWTHKTIFAYRGLIEFIEAHGFVIESVWGAGYFPLPSFLGQIDHRHAHFITVKARKIAACNLG